MDNAPNIAKHGVIIIGNLAKARKRLKGFSHAAALGLNGRLGKLVSRFFAVGFENINIYHLPF